MKSAVLACRALLRQVNTGRTSLSIIRIATKLYVFIVLSIPSASGSPVSSWMCSSVFYQWPHGAPDCFYRSVVCQPAGITWLDYLELGVVDEGLHFLQCRKLLRRVVEHLPNRHQCCKTFFRLGRHLAAEMQ